MSFFSHFEIKKEIPKDGTIIPGLSYLIDIYFDMVKEDDTEMTRQAAKIEKEYQETTKNILNFLFCICICVPMLIYWAPNLNEQLYEYTRAFREGVDADARKPPNNKYDMNRSDEWSTTYANTTAKLKGQMNSASQTTLKSQSRILEVDDSQPIADLIKDNTQLSNILQSITGIKSRKRRNREMVHKKLESEDIRKQNSVDSLNLERQIYETERNIMEIRNATSQVKEKNTKWRKELEGYKHTMESLDDEIKSKQNEITSLIHLEKLTNSKNNDATSNIRLAQKELRDSKESQEYEKSKSNNPKGYERSMYDVDQLRLEISGDNGDNGGKRVMSMPNFTNFDPQNDIPASRNNIGRHKLFRNRDRSQSGRSTTRYRSPGKTTTLSCTGIFAEPRGGSAKKSDRELFAEELKPKSTRYCSVNVEPTTKRPACLDSGSKRSGSMDYQLHRRYLNRSLDDSAISSSMDYDNQRDDSAIMHKSTMNDGDKVTANLAYDRIEDNNLVHEELSMRKRLDIGETTEDKVRRVDDKLKLYDLNNLPQSKKNIINDNYEREVNPKSKTLKDQDSPYIYNTYSNTMRKTLEIQEKIKMIKNHTEKFGKTKVKDKYKQMFSELKKRKESILNQSDISIGRSNDEFKSSEEFNMIHKKDMADDFQNNKLMNIKKLKSKLLQGSAVK